jgi:2-keto-4-pentenoate hydratase/2-oxohepta-3-ene-1,7-dioic acid hydratase in catechol pathway
MKLATFEVGTESAEDRRLGAHRDGTLIDLTASYGSLLSVQGDPTPAATAREIVPPDMLGFVRRGDAALAAARSAIDHADETADRRGPSGRRLSHDCDDVRLHSPLPRPNTIRDFITFEEHIGHFRDELPEEWYDFPVYYKGNPDSVVRPGQTVAWPSYTERFDYELEVAAVVGRCGRNVAAAEAEEYIFGYTIFNDFSARDIQNKERVVGLGPGKAKDFANGFGPYLVTADEVDTGDATMTASVNGERWSEGNLGDMYHTFPDLVEYASMDETIHPGDVLGSGTVGTGCGPEVGEWLQPGDTIELAVDGIGTLAHEVGEPARSATGRFRP